MTGEAELPVPERRVPEARLEATTRGRVQGVGFRYYVVRRALDLGLVGWVANAADGSVRCVAEGSAASIAVLEADLRAGPPGAMVDEVDAVRMMATGRFDRFAIRSGAHGGD
ncbi:MAG: acylphosphatase [Candidatus Limnocylindrales bacterium]